MNELARLEPFKAVDPFRDGLFDVIPTLFRTAVAPASWPGPRMDLSETETGYRLAVELPGIPKDAIQVSVYENTVTISAEMPAAEEAEGQTWLLRERSRGKLVRNIQLPEAVDDNASEAKYADGVLCLSLQKKRASQIKRLTVH
jgi:HSP20 family protein